MPRSLRVLNVLAALAPLASGLATLGSNLFVPRYPYRDSLLLVAAYCAFYVWVIHAFWRDRPAARRLAIVKTLGAYAFLATFVSVPEIGPAWISFTPGRYVYQLFDWGPRGKIGMFAFVFLGRGAWNTINALACTRDWWFAVRAQRPFLGRVLTVVPVGITVACVWAFLFLVRLDVRITEVHEIAQEVSETLSCDDVRAKLGTTTTDVRQRGDRRYDVEISWSCADTRVLVRDAEDHRGQARRNRSECCPAGTAPGPGPTAPAAPPA